MAFEVFDIGNGTEAIIATSGRTFHIVRHWDGTWTVEEEDKTVGSFRLATTLWTALGRSQATRIYPR